MIDRSPRTGFEVGRRPAAAQAVPKRVGPSVSAKPAPRRPHQPQPKFRWRPAATAAQRRRQRVGLLAERRRSAPPPTRAREISAIKVNDGPKPLIFQCHRFSMTPWLNRGAKKTNKPTIPLILQAFGWLNRAALARAADRTSAAAAHDRSFAPNRIRSWTSASRRPGSAKAGRPQCQCEAGATAAAPAPTQIQMAASSHSGAAAAPAGRSAGGAPSLGSASHARAGNKRHKGKRRP